MFVLSDPLFQEVELVFDSNLVLLHPDIWIKTQGLIQPRGSEETYMEIPPRN